MFINIYIFRFIHYNKSMSNNSPKYIIKVHRSQLLKSTKEKINANMKKREVGGIKNFFFFIEISMVTHRQD